MRLESLKSQLEKSEEFHLNFLKSLIRFESFRNQHYSSYLWHRMPTLNICIQELKPNYYYDAVKFIEEFYLNEELLFKSYKIDEDEESKISFLSRLFTKLQDSMSLIALDEGNNNRIAGVLILTEVNYKNFSMQFSKENLVQGEAYKKSTKLLSFLNKNINIYGKFGCSTFLRYYLVCIHPEYRGKDLSFELFSAGIRVAQSLRIPVVMGTFTDSRLQYFAKKIGMKELVHLKYNDLQENCEEHLFLSTNLNQAQCFLMAGLVPPKPPPPEKYVLESEKLKTEDKKQKKGKKDQKEKTKRKKEKKETKKKKK